MRESATAWPGTPSSIFAPFQTSFVICLRGGKGLSALGFIHFSAHAWSNATVSSAPPLRTIRAEPVMFPTFSGVSDERLHSSHARPSSRRIARLSKRMSSVTGWSGLYAEPMASAADVPFVAAFTMEQFSNFARTEPAGLPKMEMPLLIDCSNEQFT